MDITVDVAGALLLIVGWPLLLVVLDLAARRWGADSRPIGPVRWI